VNTSGLVIAVDPAQAGEVLLAVREAGPFTVGNLVDGRITVALEAEDPRSAERWHEWLRRLAGVVKVDVAFVYANPEETTHAS
jgi:nitrate reductase NapAB chaperone NapD